MKNLQLIGIVALAQVIAFGAYAQSNVKSFVSSAGADANNCLFATPCATISGAYEKTAANGEVVCSTSAPMGVDLIISRAITISCEGAAGNNMGVSTSNALVIINVAAADRVVLRGIDFDLGSSQSGNSIVSFNGAGTLVLDRCKFTGGKAASSNGLHFRPTGVGRLSVSDSIFTGAGNGTTGAGIRIAPQPGGSAQVMIKDSVVSGNTFGVAVDGTGSSAGINATIINTVAASNILDGFIAVSSANGAPAGLAILGSQTINNGFGIRSIGANITVRVDGSRIVGNGTGLSGGGAILSTGDNIVVANGTDGGFSGAFPRQ